ncbi:MAG: phosphatase PAP2 family protein [Marinibacterium sp.]|nr:phosphatase PAP2 family protein [Marinibacterium sp.]
MNHDLRLFAILWAGMLVIFGLVPGIDLAVSGLFFDDASGRFPLDHHGGLATLRRLLWDATYVIAAVVLALSAQAALSRQPGAVPARFWAFASSFVVLGPVVIVNLGLKEYWGRARPAEIAQFGGDAQFTRPWQITDQCLGNCSFVSGEAASMAAAALLVGLVVWASVPAPRRRAWLIALGTLVVLTALMRVMKGRHFLSDVLWSVLLMSTLAWGLGRLFRIAELMDRVTFAAIWSDLRRLFGHLRWILPRDLRRGWAGIGLRAGRGLLVLSLGFVLIMTTLPSHRAEKFGDNVQIALPLAGLGCAVATGQGVQYFGRFVLMTTLLHGSKNALGDIPINHRPNGGLQGFPSGHTAASFFGAAGLAQHCLAASPAAQAGVVVAAGFVASTRVAVGAHDVRQIIAGAILGWLTQVLVLAGFDRAFQGGWRWCARRIRGGIHALRVAGLNLTRQLRR